MTVRSELESIELALASLKRDLSAIADSLDGRLKFRYVAAGIRHTRNKLDGAQTYLREAHSFVPVELDKDA